MKVPQPDYFFPNQMGRILLTAMDEIIGSTGFNMILNRAELFELVENLPPANSARQFSFEKISCLFKTLEEAYGPRGGRGLAQRIGRASFRYGLRTYGSSLGLIKPSFQLLPLHTKFEHGGRALYNLFNRQTDQRVRFEKTEGYFLWHIDRCPLCWKRQSEDVVCHMAVGLLEESLYWASGGKIFQVQETQCIARGDPVCTISISQKPLE